MTITLQCPLTNKKH